jgi:hypothetical protein
VNGGDELIGWDGDDRERANPLAALLTNQRAAAAKPVAASYTGMVEDENGDVTVGAGSTARQTGSATPEISMTAQETCLISETSRT